MTIKQNKISEERVEKVPHRNLLGKAIHYSLSQWQRLIQYTTDGIIRPDNNLVENAIRPFVVGRKNGLFLIRFKVPGPTL